MPDYKSMYLHLLGETEKAIKLLCDAELECERIFCETDTAPTLRRIDSPPDKDGD